ncbi:MAG: hypothetical protein JO041_16315 [Acidobacteria bacterium]|nr:hypothetical protein [Acidobacteriota bacterium]
MSSCFIPIRPSPGESARQPNSPVPEAGQGADEEGEASLKPATQKARNQSPASSRAQQIIAFSLLGIALAAGAAAYSPEISIGRVDLNDNVFHYTLIERIVQAVHDGENPLDCWSAEWSFGFPVLRIYQPFAHLLVAAAYFASGKYLTLMTVFAWIRFLAVVLLPLTFFAAARLLGFSPLVAAAAAVLAPMVSTNYLYGMEYGSFDWAGSGLFPQAVATHFMLLALGFGYVALATGRRAVPAGLFVGLALLSQLIYGYMAAWSIALLALIPHPAVHWRLRLRRAIVVGATALLISAFQLVPLLTDAKLINHSRWEAAWKWDSYGIKQVLNWLFSGELLDHGRLPVLTILAAAGLVLYLWRRRRQASQAESFTVLGAAFWLLMYFGRPAWGVVLEFFGATADMHLHRVIGGLQIFLVLLAASALGALWHEFSRPPLKTPLAAAAVTITLLMFYPMVRERGRHLAANAAQGRQNLAAYAAASNSLPPAVRDAAQHRGRAYAGLAGGWGASFRIGSVPVYASLSEGQVPAVSFLYHAMALTGDIMVLFNEQAPAQYRLFNIQTVISPAASQVGPPGLLRQRARFGDLQNLDAPGAGYFDLVDVPRVVNTDRANSYDVNQRWLQSDGPASRTHWLLDFNRDSGTAMALTSPGSPAGEVINEAQQGQVYRAELDVLRPAYVLFKMTWHPNWVAYLDSRRQPVVMLSPGFSGVSVPAGHHRIEFRYMPGPLKPLLLLAGLLGVGLISIPRRQRVYPLVPPPPARASKRPQR